MAAAVSVFAGVPVGRGVATTRPAAGLTGSQMDPARADHDAFLTDARSRLRDRSHRLDVRASLALSGHQVNLVAARRGLTQRFSSPKHIGALMAVARELRLSTNVVKHERKLFSK